jgi:mono/diheme cytochrome c family protein
MMTRNVLATLLLAGALTACSAKTPGTPAAATGAPTPSAEAPAVISSRAAPSTEVGERIFNGNCVACHQQGGVGIPGVYPSLVASPVVLGDPSELARWVIRGQRPPSMPVGRYPTQMLQFGWLKPADAASLFTYLRSHFGNSAAPVDAATVAKALGP